MKRILIVLSLIFAVSSAFGRGISEQEAAQIAANFLNSHGVHSRSGSLEMNLALALPDNNPVIYVFNRQNGGYAIVGADDCLPYPVLGYSEKGHINMLDIPKPLLSLLEGYVSEIKKFGTLTPIMSTSTGKAVKPLIKTEWHQDRPYNNMVPTLEDGTHCVTGCVNTAQAQIMNYYKYPKQGKGIVSYTWNNHTLSADLGASHYDWDNMLDNYATQYTEQQANAVALLMRDCGYANETNYGWSSPTSVNYVALVENFGYDRGIREIRRNECSRNDFESFMRAELDAGRPLLFGGSSSSSSHVFVCDGYDSEVYFHYNYGWGGYSEGYCLTSATGYDISQWIVTGVQPECGGEPVYFFSSNRDFLWDKDRVKYKIDILSVLGRNGIVYFEFAIMRENVENGKKFPLVKLTGENLYMPENEIPLPQDLEDGNYIVYPVVRYRNSEWEKVCFSDNRQSFIDLKVKNGVYTYTNNHIADVLDEGKIDVNGIYYILSDNGEAEVTYKNNRYKSYSGDVTIPGIIIVENKPYKVTKIGIEAFRDCNLGKVRIGENVEIIGKGGLGLCSIECIEFERPTSLKKVENWGFNGCKLDEIVLPEGIESLGKCAFQNTSLKRVDIPSSVKIIKDNSFNFSMDLRHVYVHWTKESELPTLPIIMDGHIFNGCKWDEMTLYVPVGTTEMYRNASQWSDLNVVEMKEESAIDDIILNDVKIVVSDNYITIHGAPATIYNIAGVIVATPSVDETVFLPHGLYIVQTSTGHTEKVVI